MVDLGAVMHPLVYLIAYIPGVVALCTLTVGGLWTWSVPILIFGCVPLIELFWKGSGKNPSTEEEQHLKSNIVFNTLLYGIVPLHCRCGWHVSFWVVFGMVLWIVQSGCHCNDWNRMWHVWLKCRA